ncbi:MAG: formylmethanofuran dehydrogenase subunit C [Burkholderiaceae bacterium]|nr:formylmethanofuran dehydrogenase subunit C [Burkholderiaceae bacterium]
MTGFSLTLRQSPPLRASLRGILPTALSGLTAAQVAALPVGHGRANVALGEFFAVVPRDDDRLLLEGDLARFDHLGWQLDGGSIEVRGGVGDHAGGAMSGGELVVHGDARDLAGCEMAGGRLEIHGSVGDFAAGSLPGSLDGMRGGVLLVRGNAGQRLADRMRRGSLLVFGDVGDFAASRLVAGTLALGGRCGAHPGYGMRRGSVVLAGPEPRPSAPPTFVPAGADADVAWQLLARDLARLGGAGSVFAGLPQRRIRRWLGDLAAGGQGELILPE